MSKQLSFSVLVALVLSLAACAPTEGSCAFMQTGVQACAEFSGGRTDLTPSSCTSQFSGTYSDSLCVTEGRVGGCQVVRNNVTLTTWFYSGTTDLIRANCPAGQTFVAP